ncbi:citrate synthase [Paraburkholderia sp. A1RI-2L]|uniref:citrate synthase n=1 Tax=Paraburkholderia sp. A1RI-2L TaxID=3028367 RepID=UPI003B81B6C6
MSSYMTAAEAAAALGISRATLYAYVSRGMLTSVPADDANGSAHPHERPSQPQSRRYAAAEVRGLARRKADGKRAGKVAQKVLDWGVPVLESSITLIADGRLFYRGQDAIALARHASLEEVAALLWECSPRRVLEANAAPIAVAQWSAWLKLWSAHSPLERALVLLPSAATQMPRIWVQGRDAQLETGTQLMRLLAAALVCAAPSSEPLHRQLAHAWAVRSRAQAELLRAALVLCADHELNASAFTVRCITSTGMHLFGAAAGGLAALGGPSHGGETTRVAALFDEAAHADDLHRYLAQRLAADEFGATPKLPGFVHPLYPDGDPRARLLLDMLAQHASARSPMDEVDALAHAVAETTGARPTLDYALAAIERVLALPRGAAFTLFAAARVTGWIAHALEQNADGRLIRPRARYIGKFGDER